jgi:hypothetical protein
MGKINVGRWILSGVIAGVIIAIVDWVLDGMILMDQWTAAMAALGKPAVGQSTTEIIGFVVFDLVVGLIALWIYVGIRPRFGAGAMTAVYAGLAVWLLLSLSELVMQGIGLFPASLVWTMIVVGLFQVVIATVIGAYFYQEETA